MRQSLQNEQLQSALHDVGAISSHQLSLDYLGEASEEVNGVSSLTKMISPIRRIRPISYPAPIRLLSVSLHEHR